MLVLCFLGTVYIQEVGVAECICEIWEWSGISWPGYFTYAVRIAWSSGHIYHDCINKQKCIRIKPLWLGRSVLSCCILEFLVSSSNVCKSWGYDGESLVTAHKLMLLPMVFWTFSQAFLTGCIPREVF
jgi:hypothetical protein